MLLSHACACEASGPCPRSFLRRVVKSCVQRWQSPAWHGRGFRSSMFGPLCASKSTLSAEATAVNKRQSANFDRFAVFGVLRPCAAAVVSRRCRVVVVFSCLAECSLSSSGLRLPGGHPRRSLAVGRRCVWQSAWWSSVQQYSARCPSIVHRSL